MSPARSILQKLGTPARLSLKTRQTIQTSHHATMKGFLRGSLQQVAEELINKIGAWSDGSHDAGDFDATEDAEEAIRFLEALKVQYGTQILTDRLSPSKEALDELLTAQANEDLETTKACVQKIHGQLQPFLAEHRPKRGRPKGASSGKKKSGMSVRKDGKRRKPGRQGSDTSKQRKTDKKIASKGMGARSMASGGSKSSHPRDRTNVPGCRRANRMATFRIFCDLGCPAPSQWREKGDGTTSEIIRRLDMPTGSSTRECVCKTLLKCYEATEEGVAHDGQMNAENMGRPPKIKPGSQEEDMVAECLRCKSVTHMRPALRHKLGLRPALRHKLCLRPAP
mmetsp:Transcript_7065/g.19721  ORF Transcript_7065/g.19721 Transcript_7065/m.19721 type:complete len:339 (+) Transcript_7065:284-1300(+)